MLDNTVLQHKFNCFLTKTIFLCKKTFLVIIDYDDSADCSLTIE